MSTNEKVPKSSDKFYCSDCDYTTVRKSQYKRHLLTLKHGILTNTNKKVQKVPDDKSFSDHLALCTCIESFHLEGALEACDLDAMGLARCNYLLLRWG